MRSRRIAALLIALLLMASAERRLAQLHVAAAGTVVSEPCEGPDGDEIAKRLISVDDDTPPPALRLTELQRSDTDPLRPRLHPIPFVRVPIPALRQ